MHSWIPLHARIAKRLDVPSDAVHFTNDTLAASDFTSSSSRAEESESRKAGLEFRKIKELYLEDIKNWQPQVDSELLRKSGTIQRKKDPRMCRHGPKAMCSYCSPVEPYDEGYLEQNKVKHMSFQAYLRKLLKESYREKETRAGGPAKGSASLLDMPNYKVKHSTKCSHEPWPKGMCSNCQPGAITLKPQEFRMVDHVEFATPQIVNRFIDYWRSTGNQRFGYLLGRYAPYDNAPLGVKAVVEAIYEPVQRCSSDCVEVDIESEEHHQEIVKVNHIATACGLRPVGIIFTDLTDDGTGKGTCLYRRRPDTFLLSSLECMLAAQLQLKYPNLNPWSREGVFGSKFVTCCISANNLGQIEVSAWQVSNATMALQDADLIIPSTKPSMMCIKPQTHKRYVPDVYYTRINEHKAKVLESGKPAFPIEYLMVSLTYGMPNSPNPLFKSRRPFDIQNRASSKGKSNAMIHLAGAESDSELANYMSDFHLLYTLYKGEELSEAELSMIARLVTSGGTGEEAQILNSHQWLEFVSRISLISNDARWNCPHCTFSNPEVNVDCAMCGLPRRTEDQQLA
ncbi:nuclear protein localization protein 4 [Spiromyces aspiralis]|uniref:Nuclear protein localization protein 4 n=1 Tax=Spiromyces aspiralis TaxID=68401 RepID=A0ACC1HJ14_9FUNG|nr:nuclear protein localization protein 4 [Spiromyces aspiralis]